MEVRCHPGDYQRSQPFLTTKLAGSRAVKWVWFEAQYRRLKLRYKASVGVIAGLKAQLETMQRKLWQEEMNGHCIMICRDMIQKMLGVNSVRLPGLNINSPFFDDLIQGVVASLIRQTKRADQAEAALKNCLPAPSVPGQTLNLLQVKQLLAQQALAQQAQQQMAANSTAYSGCLGLGGASNAVGGTSTSSSAFYINNGSTTSTLVTSGTLYTNMVGTNLTNEDMMKFDNIIMPDGRTGKVTLPDGAIIDVAKDGSYEIKDASAKVIYRANRVREFNRFINASDILAKFIAFCGKEAAVTREEMLELPVKLFIQYLILEAAKSDGEPEPADLTLIPDLRKAANCLGCDEQLPAERRARKLHYCGPSCLEQHEQRELSEIAA